MSHSFTPNVVSSRVEDIKKRFEASNVPATNHSPHNSPEKLLLASVNGRPRVHHKSPTLLASKIALKKPCAPFQSPVEPPAKKRNGLSPAVPAKTQLTSTARGNNVRRSPAFRCDKIVKGRNVVGQRPRSLIDAPTQPEAMKTNIKRLHSTPAKRTVPSLDASVSPERLANPLNPEELSTVFSRRMSNPQKPDISLPKPNINLGIIPSKPERMMDYRNDKTNSTNVEYSKVFKHPKNVSEIKKMYSKENVLNSNKNIGSGDDAPYRQTKENSPNRTELDISKRGAVICDREQKTDNRAQSNKSSNPATIDGCSPNTTKVLNSPLPPGPPPRKPPRTFAHSNLAAVHSNPTSPNSILTSAHSNLTSSHSNPTSAHPNTTFLHSNAASNSVNLTSTFKTNNSSSVLQTVQKFNDTNNINSANAIRERSPSVPSSKLYNIGTSHYGRPATSPEKQNVSFADTLGLHNKSPPKNVTISPSNDRSMVRPLRSKTESEIMLKKLERVLMTRDAGVVLRSHSPPSRPSLDKSASLDFERSDNARPRPLPTVPSPTSTTANRLVGCLDSFNCVGSNAIYRDSHLYERLNEKNSEFFVDIFGGSPTSTSPTSPPSKSPLRKSSSVEHIYAVPYEFAKRSGSESRSLETPMPVSKKIIAVTEDKIVEIGHFKGTSPNARNFIDRSPNVADNKFTMAETTPLHYLVSPVSLDDHSSREPSLSDDSLDPSLSQQSDPSAAPRQKPSFLRLAGLAKVQATQDPKLHRAKIQMIMNQAFGTPSQGLPSLPADSGSASDSESVPSTPEEKSPPAVNSGFLIPEQPGTQDKQGTSKDPASSTDSSPDLRQLTERRKKYVRHVSCRVAPPKKPDAFPHLFHYVLLVGLNLGSGVNKAYIKRKYPADAEVTPHIEDFCFPDADEWPRPPPSSTNGKADEQSYSLVVTNDRGDRTYGYCRRVMPEGMDICLPLAYCIISPFRATGFYFKVLSALESRHGQPEVQQEAFINELYNCQLPGPNQSLKPGASSSQESPAQLLATVLAPMRSLGARTLPPATSPSGRTALAPGATIVRRPPDLRLEETDLTQLFTALNVSTLLQVFSTVLLERRVLMFSASLSKLSSCVEALQSILYPFSWQHTFIPVLPVSQIEYCDAPTPYIFGVLKGKDGQPPDVDITDGIVVDLESGRILSCVGDEATILPTKLRRSLKTALQMAGTITQPDEAARNVLISEAFLRAFVELCGHYRTHVVTQQDGKRVFERESFVKAATCRSIQMFLEWFTETTMFRQFIEQRIEQGSSRAAGLFEQRANEHTMESERNNALFVRNYKAVNKKFKTIGDRFKDWTPFT